MTLLLSMLTVRQGRREIPTGNAIENPGVLRGKGPPFLTLRWCPGAPLHHGAAQLWTTESLLGDRKNLENYQPISDVPCAFVQPSSSSSQ